MTKFVRFCLLLLLAAVALARPSHADEGPRDLVTGYMDALKTKDYIKALHYVGIDLPVELGAFISPLLEEQPYFTWSVKNYQLLKVRQDGGLAVVTVQETQFKDLTADARSVIAAKFPVLSNAIIWGDNVVTERFVLVRLDGRWRFDAGHSGIQTDELMKSMMGIVTQRISADGTPPDQVKLQQDVAKFINGVGFGQLLHSLASSAPVVPVIAAIAIPNFVRARGQGQTTACKSNLKNMGTALEMYSTDNSGRYATALSQLTPNYLKTIPTCPSAQADTYSRSYVSASNPDVFTIICEGQYHKDAGLQPNYPQYTSTEGIRTGAY